MAKKHTTVTIDGELREHARGERVPIAKVTEEALEDAPIARDYYVVTGDRDMFGETGSGKATLPGTGVTVSVEGGDSLDRLAGLEPGDILFLRIEGQGLRAEGRVMEDWRRGEVAEDPASVPDEYLVPTKWLVVLEEPDVVDEAELAELTGASLDGTAIQHLDDAAVDVPRLQETIRDRGRS